MRILAVKSAKSFRRCISILTVSRKMKPCMIEMIQSHSLGVKMVNELRVNEKEKNGVRFEFAVACWTG